MGWACGAYVWGEEVYRVLLGKPEGRRPLGRPRCRWVDNIRMDLKEVGIWTGLGWPRIDRWRTLVSAVMNLRVPWNAENFLTSCKPVNFSRRTLHHGVSKYIFVSIKSTSLHGMIWTAVSLTLNRTVIRGPFVLAAFLKDHYCMCSSNISDRVALYCSDQRICNTFWKLPAILQ